MTLNNKTRNEFAKELLSAVTNYGTGRGGTDETVLDESQCDFVVDLIVDVVNKVLESRGFVYSKSGE